MNPLELVGHWWEALAGSAFVVGALGWFGKRQLDRLDRLEREKASSAEIASIGDKVERHADEIRNSMSELHGKVDRSFIATSDIAQRVAHIEGKLAAAEGRR